MKRLLGQYYTTVNVFNKSWAFELWLYRSKIRHYSTILEPFAGANNIKKMLEHNYPEWVSYDIDPADPEVVKEDTLTNFPKGYNYCITNPPFLTMKGRKPMHMESIKLILENCKNGAIIMPASFFNHKLFSIHRFIAWDFQERYCFDDTTEPVGVAYFIEHNTHPLRFFINGKEVYIHDDNIPVPPDVKIFKFNTPDYNVIFRAVDTSIGEKICIQEIPPGEDVSYLLKPTSRHIVLANISDIDLIDPINHLINKWRVDTKNIFLTPFKSIGKDGIYRRRMCFNTLNWLATKLLTGLE